MKKGWNWYLTICLRIVITMIKQDEKMYTIKVKKGSLAYKWMENQDSYTGAFKEVIGLIVEEFGEGNLKEAMLKRRIAASNAVIDRKESFTKDKTETIKPVEKRIDKNEKPKIKDLGMLTEIG